MQGESYDFRITAVADANADHARLTATSLPCGITPEGENILLPTPAAVPTPANFRVVKWADNALTLGWDPPPGIAGADIIRYELQHRALGAGTEYLRSGGMPDPVVPATPVSGAQIVVPADGQDAIIRWDTPDSDAEYEIRYSRSPTFFDPDAIDILTGQTPGFIFGPGADVVGTRRYFQIRISNSEEESPWSPEDQPLLADLPRQEHIDGRESPCFTNHPVDAPEIIHAEEFGADSFRVEWAPPADAATDVSGGYEIRYADAGDQNLESSDEALMGGRSMKQNAEGGLTSHTVDELASDRRYFVQVRVGGVGLEDEAGWGCAATVWVGRIISMSQQESPTEAPTETVTAKPQTQLVANLRPSTTYEFQLRVVTRHGTSEWTYTLGTTLRQGAEMSMTPPAPSGDFVAPPSHCVATPAGTPDQPSMLIDIVPGMGGGAVPTDYRIEFRIAGETGWQVLRLVPAGPVLTPTMPPVIMDASPPEPDLTPPPTATRTPNGIEHRHLAPGVRYEYRVWAVLDDGRNYRQSPSPSGSCSATTPGARDAGYSHHAAGRGGPARMPFRRIRPK